MDLGICMVSFGKKNLTMREIVFPQQKPWITSMTSVIEVSPRIRDGDTLLPYYLGFVSLFFHFF